MKHNEVIAMLENLNKLGHIKDFELFTIKEYIENLEKTSENVILENMNLKQEIHARKAQVDILKEILEDKFGNLFLDEEGDNNE